MRLQVQCSEEIPRVLMGTAIAVKCCMCHQIQEGQSWVPEQDRSRSGLRYSHGYCPECYSQAMSELSVCSMSAS